MWDRGTPKTSLVPETHQSHCRLPRASSSPSRGSPIWLGTSLFLRAFKNQILRGHLGGSVG